MFEQLSSSIGWQVLLQSSTRKVAHIPTRTSCLDIKSETANDVLVE